ncbi:MAG: DddA-like double-stranded DNA deaminase toxin [Haloechinothrix sp.]
MLTGILVVAAAAWAAMNLYLPNAGKFSCHWKPAILGAGVAHADEGCPESLRGAWSDSEWAADRIAELGTDLTAGRVYEDGVPHYFDSTQNSDSETALKVGREVGAFPSKGRPVVVDHVEVKVAAAMREGDVATGVLVINHPDGPCRRKSRQDVYRCMLIVPRLLAPGTTLLVWWQDNAGTIRKHVFKGR